MSVMNTWSPQCPQPFLCSLTLLLLHHIIIRKNTLWSFFFLSSQCFNWISPRGTNHAPQLSWLWCFQSPIGGAPSQKQLQGSNLTEISQNSKPKIKVFAVKKMFLIWHRSAWRYCGKVRSTAFWHVRQKQAKSSCVKPLVKCSSSIQFPFSFST